MVDLSYSENKPFNQCPRQDVSKAKLMPNRNIFYKYRKNVKKGGKQIQLFLLAVLKGIANRQLKIKEVENVLQVVYSNAIKCVCTNAGDCRMCGASDRVAIPSL